MTKGTRKAWWHYIGPGLISGASDNDPTTVATLAVIGSTTTYVLGWLVLLVIPMLATVQFISSAVGGVTQAGLETTLRKHYGKAVAAIALVALLAVNLLTLAADLEGGAAALQLLTQLDFRWFVLPLAAISAAFIIVLDYKKTQNVLVYIPMLFLTYVVAAFLAHPDWHAVLANSFIPHFHSSPVFVTGAIALLGTTLTAYAYVWQTIEVAEEKPPLRRLGLVQADAGLGSIVAGLSFWFILIATGATLGAHHKEVQTADDAAQALAPFAGRWASVLFGAGLLGSSLLAVPVLGATTSYVTAALFQWQRGIDHHFWRAPKFFLVLLASLAIASIVGLVGIAPIKLLFVSSIAGGIATPVTLGLMILVARNSRIMGKHRVGFAIEMAGWVVFAIVTAATLLFFVQLVRAW